jgi:hypothetical protein
MNHINRWKEYDAGELTPPCVVQHDEINEEHLSWVWTGNKIIQVSRKTYDEQAIIDEVMEMVAIETQEVI